MEVSKFLREESMKIEGKGQLILQAFAKVRSRPEYYDYGRNEFP